MRSDDGVKAIRPAGCAACLCALIAWTGAGAPSGGLAAQGTVYYVGPAGSDENPGTEARPFGTIQQAADIVAPGDTVVVEDGTYTDTGLSTPCGGNESRPVVCLARGGTPAAPVTFRARNKRAARIDGRSNANSVGFRFLKDANYVQVDGFEIYGMGNDRGSASGLELYEGGHDVVITQNNIHDIGRLCTDVSNGQTGIFVEQPRVTITRNIIHDIGRFAPGENDCSPKTRYYANHDHGVYVDGNPPGANDVLISNNIFHGHRRGWAIQVYPGAIAGLGILNNTFAFENPFSDGHVIIGASLTDARIVNNLFDEPRAVAIQFYAGTHADVTIAHNLSSRLMADRAPDGVAFSNNRENAAPGLVPGTFRPGPASPAIDGGTSLEEVGVDIDAVPRPQGRAWDIGAFEAGGDDRLQPPRVIGIRPT